MLKRMITGLVLIGAGLLGPVRGDEGFPGGRNGLAAPFAEFKEHCPEQNVIVCYYWNSNRPGEYQSADIPEEGTPGNKDGGEEAPKEKPGEILVFPGNRLSKRFLVPRRKNPTARGYKRGPGFRSWGGKRNSVPSRQSLDIRGKFEPWGGKRDGEFSGDSISPEEAAGKRVKFQNWGGKRSRDEMADGPMDKRGSVWKGRFYFGEPFKKDVPKRPQFQSWGGKRALHPWVRMFGFSGYRPSRYFVTGGEKRKFSSWGGKRNEYDGDDLAGHVTQNWERTWGPGEGDADDLPGAKKSAFDDVAPQISQTLTTNGKPPLGSDPWGERERDENDKR